MLLRARLLAPILLLLLAFSSSAIAQSWKYISPEEVGGPRGMHNAAFEGRVSVSYNPGEQQWYLAFGVSLTTRVGEPTLRFTNGDGSSRTYSLKPELITIAPQPEGGYSISRFPIGSVVLEFLQSEAYVSFNPGDAEYRFPLTGSRAAISRAIELVEHDIAQADDDAHTIGQAASDEAQARARADAAAIALAECDGLTAHAWDQNATAPGVSWADLDGESAVAACEDARDLGSRSPRLIYQLGRAYDKTGNKLAFEYMHLAGWEMGYAAALYHLGLLHEDGLYTPKNLAEAERAFRRGTELGNVPSEYSLGKLLLERANSELQQIDAELLIQSSAIAGFPRALEYFGNLILDGKSTTTNRGIGMVYLSDASEKGRATASYRIATMYRDGIVVSADQQQYMFFLKRAAQQGNVEAQKELGG